MAPQTVRPPDGIPNAAEFGLLRAHLAQSGVSQAQIQAVIGNNPSGRTRAEIVALLKAWLAGL
jgi:hypothetical protein